MEFRSNFASGDRLGILAALGRLYVFHFKDFSFKNQ